MLEILRRIARIPLRITDAYLDLWRREAGLLDPATMVAIGISLAISAISYGIMALLAPKPPPVVGPRLDDLGQPTTNPGRPIPKATGRNITSAQIIWSTGLVETQHTDKVKGGKGGGKSVKVVSYTYSTSLAIAFNDGEICGVNRIIANGSKVIWSKRIGEGLTKSEIDTQVTAKYDEVFAEQTTLWTAVVDLATGLAKYTATEVEALADANANNESKQLRNQLESANDDVQPRYNQIEFYDGTETQDPSPVIEAHEGVGNVSAFRGTAYIVIEDLELADFGNFPPGFTIDYATVGEVGPTVTTSTGPDTGTNDWNDDEYLIDYTRERIFAMETGLPSWTIMYEFNSRPADLGEIQTHDLTILSGDGGGAMELRGLDEKTGYLVGWHSFNPTGPDISAMKAYVYDPVNKTVITNVTFNQAAFLTSPSPSEEQIYTIIESSDGTSQAVFSTDFASASDTRNTILNFPALTFNSRFTGPEEDVEVGGDPKWVVGQINSEDRSDTAWALWVSADNIQFRKMVISNAGVITQTDYASHHRTEFHASEVFATPTNGFIIPYIDGDDGTIVGIVATDRSPTNGFWVFKWNPVTDTILWATDLHPFRSLNPQARGNTRLKNGFLVLHDELEQDVQRINLADGTATSILGDFVSDIDQNSASWDGVNGCLYTATFGATFRVWRVFCFGAICFDDPISIGDVIRAYMSRAGYASSEYEITAALDLETIWGFSDNSGRSTRDLLEDLSRIRPVIVNEIEGKLRFRLADQSVVATIPKADVRAYDGQSEPPAWIAEVQTFEDLALPKSLRITYQDIDRALNPTTAIFTREITQSRTVNEFAVQAVDTAEAMRNSVFTAMSVLMTSKRTFKLLVPLKYVMLEPGDVIVVPISETRTAKVRIGEATLGANLIIELECALYIDTSLGITHTDQFTEFLTDVAVGATVTDLHLLDIPYLTDEAEENGAGAEDNGIYVAMSTRDTGWPGANLYIDRQTTITENAFGVVTQLGGAPDWELVANVDSPIAVGTLVIPPDPLASALVQDIVSEMVVSFRTPEADFESVSATAQLTTQDNVFMVGNELIQARTVLLLNEKEGFRTYQFSDLWRGLQGTEWAIGTQATSDEVIHMDPAGLARVDLENGGLIGLDVDFRAVTIGSDLTAAETTNIAYDAASRKPWAPSIEDVVRDEVGNLTFTLMQRNRYGSLWTPATSPFESDPDDFEVDILSISGGSPDAVRTIVVSGTTTISYTAAQQATDFGSPLVSTVTVRVYQLNATGRRGFVREETI